jgi:hypothetical protein
LFGFSRVNATTVWYVFQQGMDRPLGCVFVRVHQKLVRARTLWGVGSQWVQ